MKLRTRPAVRNHRAILILLLVFGTASEAIAETVQTKTEINHLLVYLESSGCDFFRNGSWYKAKQAREHLEKKYHYLEKRELINSAEDFIVRGASSSSFSGQKYQVRCPNSKPISSSSWLSMELLRFRKSEKN